MVKIKLIRQGAKKKPFYRLVAVDSKKRGKGSFLDLLGYYHPQKDKLVIDKKKLSSWQEKGAQLSLGARKLLLK